jgi:RNA polymerase sigma factor (sigma-70 family)
MFVRAKALTRRKTGCFGCPVRIPCLAHALDTPLEFGVWGGWDEQERQALLHTGSEVNSWFELLEAVGTDYEKVEAFLKRERRLRWLSPEEEAAFVAVFRARFVPLMGFLIKAGASRHDAEDAAQSACVELARVWRTVDRPGPWLRTTAFRMWLKTVHRMRPEELTDDEIPESSADDHSDDVAETMAMVQLLRRLPPLQRTVMAFAIDGCTPSETAEVLDKPAENIRQNLKRARKKLERLLTEDGGGVE